MYELLVWCKIAIAKIREEEIDEIVFPHPTTSEIMKDVFMAVR